MYVSKSIKFHFYKSNCLLASKDGWVLRSIDGGITWQRMFEVELVSPLYKISLFKRLLRGGIHNVVPLNNDRIAVVIKKNIIIYHKVGNNIFSHSVIKIPRGSRPLRNAILYSNGKLIYGDYWGNPSREQVRIYSIDIETGISDILLSFSNARHVHFIQQDKINQSKLLIGTGDEDEESNIYFFDLNTYQLEIIGGGTQYWRAVSVVQKDNRIYWGSDCPHKQNYIFEYNRETKNTKKIIQIAGPAYYSCINKDGVVFIATTIEDRNKHKAIIYRSESGSDWSELLEFKKDILNEKIFGYGVIDFIYGQEEIKDTFINLHGLRISKLNSNKNFLRWLDEKNN